MECVHVFLPRRIPQFPPEEQLQLEANLLKHLCHSLAELSRSIPELKTVSETFYRWKRAQISLTEESETPVVKQVKELRPADFLPIFLRAQNALLLLHILPAETMKNAISDRNKRPDGVTEDNNLVVAVFHPSLPAAQVTEAFGDLHVTYPYQSIKAKRSAFLTSEEFGMILRELGGTEFPIAMTRSSKAGQEHMETRDARMPILVTEWLSAVLGAEAERFEWPQPVVKKYRDVAISNGFRRSPMWISIKAVLQLILAQKFGYDRGRMIYKLTMLHLMVVMPIGMIDDDFVIEMMAKLSRRATKISNQKESLLEYAPVFESLLRQLEHASSKVRHLMEKRWASTCSSGITLTSAKTAFIKQAQQYTVHEDLTDRVLTPIQIIPRGYAKLEVPQCPPRYRGDKLISPHWPKKSESTLDIIFLLDDTERNVRRYSWDETLNANSSYVLLTLLQEYLDVAIPFYATDPIGKGRMTLTSLKIIQLLHEIAVDVYPELNNHRHGIDFSILEELILPLSEDLELAQSLEEYFSSTATEPSLLEPGPVDRNSFAVTFAQHHGPMQKLLQKLKKRDQHQEKVKLEELEAANEKIRSFEEKSNSATHTHGKGLGCTRCAFWKRARSVKVQPYEKCLPEKSHLKWAVVFELSIPVELAALRDALYVFGERVTKTVVGKEKLVGLWQETEELKSEHNRAQRHVILGSSTVRTKQTPAGSPIHPKGVEEEHFILNHGFDLQYSDMGGLSLQPVEKDAIKRDLCFHVEQNSKYRNLQWAIENTTHSQNKVLASQVHCDPNLSLTEYREFGSLRVGHRLQLRNIFRSLEENILSFNEESVAALICQTLWQAGPQSEPASVVRDSHRDIEDPEFVSEMLSKLEQLVEEVADNWEKYCGLLRIIVVAVRIYSFVDGEDVSERVLAVLMRSRAVAMRWCDKIEAQVQKSADVSFRQLLVKAAVCSALTFWYDDFPEQVALPAEYLFDWLKTVSRINDNLQYIKDSSSETFCSNWLRVVSRVGIKLETSLINGYKSDSAGLLKFVNEYWGKALENELVGNPSVHPKLKQFCVLNYKTARGAKITVEIDIIRGVVLLNGNPLTGLPDEIKQHEEFCRLFDTNSFSVVLASLSVPYFETSQKYDGSLFSFQMSGSELTIIETLENQQQWELVPHKKFNELIPPAFINQYSHWLNRTDHIIEFRPKRFNDEGFHKSTKIYIDLTRQKLIKDRLELLDIHSNPYDHIVPILRRLEHKTSIHIWLDTETRKTTIELHQMGLTFLVEDDKISSKEYDGFKIAGSQQLGAFVGLRNGLLLEASTEGTLPLLLMPHGPVNFHAVLNGHHLVSIDTTKLRSPRFFVYEIDHRLRTLMAARGVVPWLYQAYLFAATSSCLPNPFTGETGVETSIQLLQSPRCWSAVPFEKEALTILEGIAELSPIRKYGPRVLEHCTWQPELSSFAAHDAYVLIVNWLLQESQRLAFCFPGMTPPVLRLDDIRLKLGTKHYLKSISIYPEFAKLSEDITGSFAKLTIQQARLFDADANSACVNNTRAVVEAVNQKRLLRTEELKPGCLTALLMTRENLIGVKSELLSLGSSLIEWLELNFRDNWMTLFEYARKKHFEHQWKLILATLAFNGVDEESLNLLLMVSTFPEKFQNIYVPLDDEFEEPKDHAYDEGQIEALLEPEIGVDELVHYERNDLMERIMEDVKTRIDQENTDELEEAMRELIKEELQRSAQREMIEKVKEEVKNAWLQNRGAIPFRSRVTHISLDVTTKIDLLLSKWEKNSRLHQFLVALENTMISISRKATDGIRSLPLDPIVIQKTLETHPPFEFLTLDDLIDERGSVAERHEEFAEIFETGQWGALNDTVGESEENAFPLEFSGTSVVEQCIRESLEISWGYRTVSSKPSAHSAISSWNSQQDAVRKQSHMTWNHIQQKLSVNSTLQQICYHAGVYPRCTPTALLRRLEMKKGSVMEAVGAMGVLWVLEQKLERLIMHSKDGKASEVALERELCEQAHGNWSPKKHPEWLLFELENRLSIRGVQVDVAMKMLFPDGPLNTVMQLNMGEGKTTVILPIIAASLADGNNLCRVTVLTSLFHTNFQDLRHKLGGMLNRRVYDIPCKRAITVDASRAQIILDIFQECQYKKGVVLTLPESRLSFQLKGYEAAQKNRSEDSRMLLDVQEWLNYNARDILDESDEILRPKYQLVYTMGEQLMADGGTLRWELFQELLQLIPDIFYQLRKEPNFSECVEIEPSNEKQRYPRCRVLDVEKCRDVLSERLVDAVLSGMSRSARLVNLPPHIRTETRDFILSRTTDADSHKRVIDFFTDFHNNPLTVLFILKGLIGEGSLVFVLSKRWRVSYGVNPKGPRLTAVPFKAKDIACENTEFGHADVAIGFTLLSYYFSGLSDEQLLECFNRLDRIQDADDEYNSWIKICEDIHPSIAKLSNVNLNDYTQRTQYLFKALRFNVRTIHFWLDTVVFSRESKQFPYKLVATPWDLTSHRAATGFSGTNDRKLLLPLSYTQKDLPQLLGTNGDVLQNVLRQENNRSEFLPPLCKSKAIIQKLVEYDSPLLLDVGGLVLMSNEDVAAEWLKIAASKIEAAVYLDRKDRLVVKDRRRPNPMLLEASPYRQRLDLCIIYLDQYHCRGTDLKIPTGTVGVVTLGSGVTKDQLWQGVMRMRLLGKGHSIRFLIPHELRAAMPDPPQTKHIIKWAVQNTAEEIADDFIHWSIAGCNYLRKHSSKVVFDKSSISNHQLESFGNDCTESEIIDLKELYGVFKEPTPFLDIISRQLVNLKFHFGKRLSQIKGRPVNAEKKFNEVQMDIIRTCERYIPNVVRYQSRMNEEQQRELEQELQEERQVRRPIGATPMKPIFDPQILDFVLYGDIPKRPWAKLLPEGLSSTSLWREVQPNCWGEDIYVTEGFTRVIKCDSVRDGLDEFLRPLNWMVMLPRENPIILILSPHEANEVIPHFWEGTTATQLHMFAPPRQLNQDNLVTKLVMGPRSIQTPPSSTIANLSLFGGAMYFQNRAEQEAFCSLLGIIPQPRTEEEQEIFDRSGSRDGFILQTHRPSNWPCKFSRSAEPLVKGIINRRWQSCSPNSHISCILYDSIRPFR